MSFEEIFNPSLSHAKDYINAEKILPAPAPVAGGNPLDDLGVDLFIPTVTWGAGVLPDPPQVAPATKVPSTKKAASTKKATRPT